MTQQSKATIDELHELHGEVARELTKRVRSGEAAPADISAAIKFLKDNNVQQVAVPGSPLADLAGSLPFADNDLHFPQ